MAPSWRVRRLTLFAAFAFVLPAIAQQYSDHYALILDDAPVAVRFPGRDAHRGAPAESYRKQVLASQAAVRRGVGQRRVAITGSVDTVLNAVFVRATPAQAVALGRLAGVKAVVR